MALSYRAADHTVIAFSGHLQPGNIPVFSDRMAEGFTDGVRHLVLDLHLVRSIHPLAVDVLEMALRRAARQRQTIAAAGAEPTVRAALDPLSARGLLIRPTVHQALNAP